MVSRPALLLPALTLLKTFCKPRTCNVLFSQKYQLQTVLSCEILMGMLQRNELNLTVALGKKYYFLLYSPAQALLLEGI